MSSRYDIVQLCAYVALVLTALILLLGALGVEIDLLNTIAQISALIGLAFAAYSFARKQRQIAWIIIYWVAIAIYLFAIIFPLVK